MFRIIFLIFGSTMALPGNAKIESMLQNPVQYKVFVLFVEITIGVFVILWSANEFLFKNWLKSG